MWSLSISLPTHAQSLSAPAAAGGFDVMALLPFVAIIAIFYFMLIRPQQKRMKQQREMLSNLRRGDTVVTAGGIIGKIARIENEQEIELEVARDVIVRLNRSAISDVLSKTVTASKSQEPETKAANNAEEKETAKEKTTVKKALPAKGTKASKNDNTK